VINTGNNHYHLPDGIPYPEIQNKDTLAIQLKLNELVAAHEFASNRLVDVENMTEDELRNHSEILF
jgi:low affinity Fe/Cu permease